MVVFLVIEGCNPPTTIYFGALPEKAVPEPQLKRNITSTSARDRWDPQHIRVPQYSVISYCAVMEIMHETEGTRFSIWTNAEQLQLVLMHQRTQ
jgi:hypothetical protein